MSYFVSRQNYWPDGEHVVEINSGGVDSAGPDMLVASYPGEGQEYDDPREAVRVALAIRNAWRENTDEEIGVGYGNTWGGSLPVETAPDEEVVAWAEERYAKLPKCDRCGNMLPKQPHVNGLEQDDGVYCSFTCAQAAMFDIERQWEEEQGDDE